MSPAALLELVQSGLVLLLGCALPPLLAAALAGAAVDFVQARLGVREPTPPALARLGAGFLALLLCAPWMAQRFSQFATALWAALPAYGR